MFRLPFRRRKRQRTHPFLPPARRLPEDQKVAADEPVQHSAPDPARLTQELLRAGERASWSAARSGQPGLGWVTQGGGGRGGRPSTAAARRRKTALGGGGGHRRASGDQYGRQDGQRRRRWFDN